MCPHHCWADRRLGRGKCGVNIAEGKNLVGAFKQPAAVICDTSSLITLPHAEFAAGLGELAKYHFLTSSSGASDSLTSSSGASDSLTSSSGAAAQLDRLALTPRVARCVRIKADVVAEDETESGRRAILNYGHTWPTPWRRPPASPSVMARQLRWA